MGADPQRGDEPRALIEGRLRFSPVLGHAQQDGRWVARLANTVEDDAGRLVTIELRGDRAEVAERILSVGCRVRASGRWAGRRFDVDRFDVEAEDLTQGRRYRLTPDRETQVQMGERHLRQSERRPGPQPGVGEQEGNSTSDATAEPRAQARSSTGRSEAPESKPPQTDNGEGRAAPGLHGRHVDGDGVLRI